MPKKRKDIIITTISIAQKHVDWITANTDDTVSGFIRKLMDVKINESIGYEIEIKEIEERIKESRLELDLLQQEHDQLTEKNSLWKENQETERLSGLIAKAIKKIKYSSWQEAANDLDSARKEIDRESFMALVETIWLQEQIGDGEIVPFN